MRNWAAFGMGLFIAAIAAFILAVMGCNNPVEYFIYCSIWFTLSCGSSLVVFYSVDIYLLYLGYLDKFAFMKLETARKYKQLDELNKPVVVENIPKPTVVYDRSAKWQDWFISVFEWCGESGIYYRNNLDAVMTYDLWRKVLCKSLMDHQPPLIEPVQNGDRTELRGGLTCQAILTLLKSGMLVLPCSTEYDPPPRIEQNANAETRQKRDETGQTVYAKDTKR